MPLRAIENSYATYEFSTLGPATPSVVMADTLRANEELSESHTVLGRGASGPEAPRL